MSQKTNSNNQNTTQYSNDSNYAFLLAQIQYIRRMNRHRMECDSLNLKDIDQKIINIMHQLSQLNPDQKNQWRQIQQSKIFQLTKTVLESDIRFSNHSNRSTKLKALKQHLRILVMICNRQKMMYNVDSIMQAIKKIYYSQYRQEIFEEFKKVGYSTYEFELINANEEASFFNFCCCIQENSYM